MPCIFHIDMDAFFASVEIRQNPSLKGKPVIIGGRPDSRGVVSTCSYEARVFGVHSAMSLNEAHRLCPHGIFLEGNYSLYKECSSKIISIFHQFTPYVEVVSIDEAYIDVSSLMIESTPNVLAVNMKKQVLQETGLTCSIGIASNKLIAKIASSKSKPNGLLEIVAGNESLFLSPLPIQSIPGIGTKTQEILNKNGIKTIADLQKFSLEELIQAHGSFGYYYYQSSRGLDNRPVKWEDSSPKSIGAETTFSIDQTDLLFLTDELKLLFTKAYKRLRAHKMRSKRVSLKIRYSNFKTISRSLTLTTHSNDASFLFATVLELFYHHYQGSPPLRLVGVSLEQLTDSYWQPTFW